MGKHPDVHKRVGAGKKGGGMTVARGSAKKGQKTAPTAGQPLAKIRGWKGG